MLNGLIPLWISPLQCTKVYTGTLNGATMLNDLLHWIPPCNAQKFIQVHQMELPCFITIDITLDPTFAVHISYTGTLNGATINDLISHWIPPLQRTEVYTGTLFRSPMLNDL